MPFIDGVVGATQQADGCETTTVWVTLAETIPVWQGKGQSTQWNASYVHFSNEWLTKCAVGLGGGRWRENLSSGTECHFPCTFWAFAPVLVNLLLPWAFSSCLPVMLKAPCCTEHLKIHIICSKLRLASSSWTQPSEQRCLSGGKAGCIVSSERGVPSSVWHAPGKLSAGNFDYPVGFSSYQHYARGCSCTSDRLGRTVESRDGQKSELSTLLPKHFSPHLARSQHWEAQEVISALPDQPHLLRVLWSQRHVSFWPPFKNVKFLGRGSF